MADSNNASATTNRCIPKIIHISGASGSGKTTLGKIITNHFSVSRIAVIEIDLYLQPDYEDAQDFLHLSRDSPEYKSKWLAYMETKFRKDLVKYANKDVIVFIGLLCQMGPIMSEECRDIIQSYDYSSYPLFFPCEKFYLNTPLKTILKRFYTRLFETSHNDRFWEWVSTDKNAIPSSREHIAHCKATYQWYCETNGYIPSTSIEILSQIGFYLCSSQK